MKRVVVLGAGSFVAPVLIKELLKQNHFVIAISRQPDPKSLFLKHQKYQQLPLQALISKDLVADSLVSLMPLWEAAPLMPKLKLKQLSKAVFLSSSSVTTKKNASSAKDRQLAQKLLKAEDTLERFFQASELAVIFLRPTMLFGYGKDQNLSFILSNLKRWPVMPLLGQAEGLRQPLHTDDLVEGIVLALAAEGEKGRIELGGATRLTYQELVRSLALAAKLTYRPVHLPRWVLVIILFFITKLAKYKFLDIAMFDRMNENLMVDNTLAQQSLGFEPQTFQEALAKEFPAASKMP